ncbi:MAG TPA: RHS repeat-associated core domain-containing protein [Chitinophagaceae bacterium]|nr:RHS repeat-associated core domain-containing protein [Chitinophagaceae bacterium]
MFFEPNNSCMVLNYVKTHFQCNTRNLVDPGYTRNFPVLTLSIPGDDGNNDLPDEDGPYNENDRKPIWWYHSDHLGSSTYLTDNFGRPSHYYETLPFGEMIVEHNQSSYYKDPYPTTNTGTYDNKFKFNGKELDDATQMYYYGARYYDPRISIFVSVDQMVESTMTPYQYVNNNPIMFTDPDGRAPEHVFIIFNKSTGRLIVTDLDHFKKGLPAKVVSAKDYVYGGIRDANGKLTHNQMLVIENVFSGGSSTDGIITRDLESDPKQLPIPNGRYDLLEYEGRDNWYKVDPIDSSRYDDHHQGELNSGGETRSGYRLHIGGLSHGCITCDNSQGSRDDEWNVLETILNNTSKTSVPKREGNQKYVPFTSRLKYGTIKVRGEDNIKSE